MANGELMVVAGEASGDLHAADVLAELRRRRPELRAFGMGGARLEAAGLERLFDAREISVMGIAEVLPRLPRIWRVFRALVRAARQRRPAAALLVDVPDFNLRLARKLRRLGIPVVFYVSPTVWAWRRGRVRQIARDVDRMLCILPFEEDFYRTHGVRARYVGNPVVEQVPPPGAPEAFRRALGLEHRPTHAGAAAREPPERAAAAAPPDGGERGPSPEGAPGAAARRPGRSWPGPRARSGARLRRPRAPAHAGRRTRGGGGRRLRRRGRGLGHRDPGGRADAPAHGGGLPDVGAELGRWAGCW